MSASLLRKRLKPLEEAQEKGWNIDGHNNVVMAQAPPLDLVQTGYQSHILQFMEIMVNPVW